MKRRLLGIALILILAVPPLAGSATFEAGSDYRIDLPDGWMEIPADEIRTYEAAVAKASHEEVKYDYAYQFKNDEGWFRYPYVLVQINRDGKIEKDELEGYEKVDEDFTKTLARMEESAGGLMAKLDQHKLLYDPEHRMLWCIIALKVEGTGPVKALTALKLTEYGYIHFTGYAAADAFRDYVDGYREMAMSIHPGEADVYKTEVPQPPPTIFGVELGPIGLTVLTGAMIVTIVGLFNRFTRKRAGK